MRGKHQDSVTRVIIAYAPTHVGRFLRQGFIEEKTATYNRLRGLISEFGVIAPQSTDVLRHRVSAQKNSLPLQVQQCVDDLMEHVDRIEDNSAEYDRMLSRMAKEDHHSQQRMELKGTGPTRLVCWSPVSVMHMILRMDANG